MIKRILRHTIPPLWALFAFSAGIFVAPLSYGILKDSSWSDALSATSTTLGLILAAITYHNWKRQKIREDAYQTTKLYITTLVSIESSLIKISNLILTITPTSGLIPPTKTRATTALKLMDLLQEELRSSCEQLQATRQELSFWGVTLSVYALKSHEDLLEGLNSYFSALYCLQNDLTNMYIHELENQTTLPSYALLFERLKVIWGILENRKTKNMKTIFDF